MPYDILTRGAGMDSTLAYYINQLENFDRTLHMPLTAVTYMYDINLRTDITAGSEATSFERTDFGAAGTESANGLPWLSGGESALTAVSVTGEKVFHPLRPMGHSVAYTVMEIERAQKYGVDLPQRAYMALQKKYQMSTDQMVYVGDTSLNDKATGLINNPDVSVEAIAKSWTTATPKEILADVNVLLGNAFVQAATATAPDTLLVPPVTYSILAGSLVSDAGTMSVLNYIKANNLSNDVNGTELKILPRKWCKEGGASNKNRIVAYKSGYEYVRYPMIPIKAWTPQYRDLSIITPYYWLLGEVEIVQPDLVRYADGV